MMLKWRERGPPEAIGELALVGGTFSSRRCIEMAGSFLAVLNATLPDKKRLRRPGKSRRTSVSRILLR